MCTRIGVYKARPAYRALIVPIYLACAPPPLPFRLGSPVLVFPRPPATMTIFATQCRAESSSPRGRARAARSRKCGSVRALESPCRASAGSARRIPEVFPGQQRRPVPRRRDDRLTGNGRALPLTTRRAPLLSRNNRAIALAPFSTQAQSSVDISPNAHPSRR